ncbi:MAG: VapC toxin family PIN domain ribonuclease [Chitinivibrionales bacterium]|nr:VapC toxin family PIN domain ribonuclease [Chitinivibrionales bacterium]MBD3397364.1 VapC toxin family PIN domain ribonuclease [Chitinivibrionales bacterium]
MVKPKPKKAVVDWIRGCEEESAFVCVLTLGKNQEGISKLRDERLRAKIQRWLDTDLRERLGEGILPVSEEMGFTWGITDGEAEAKGRHVPALDGLIGAMGITHDLTVITRNADDITAAGARILDLWAA